MTIEFLSPEKIFEAQNRIFGHLNRTPLMESSLLNNLLGHEIIFKVEGFQKIGAFKARGALNTVLHLKENGQLAKEIAAFSSGNHAQAVALAGSKLGIKTTVFLPSFTSKIKQQATRSYGAEVILTPTRQEAERLMGEKAKNGANMIHPYDNDDVITGQGTACLEALQDGVNPDAVFAPCGGGGLLSGTYLACQTQQKPPLVFAGEPKNANDAAISYRTGQIFKFENSPQTIADGARALSVSERTLQYISKVNGFYEIEEKEILYWTQWTSHLLKIICEPTSAIAVAAAYKWLSEQSSKKRALVILSGSNVAPETHKEIWHDNYLDKLPVIEKVGKECLSY